MREARTPELVMGAVQLGLDYGAANRTGKPSRPLAMKLVQAALDAGITKYDTARAYGDSEDRLGEALGTRKSVRTITKLSPLSELDESASRSEIRASVDASIASSLSALRRDRLDCLLLHRAAHMTAFNGAIWERLIERLEDGSVLSLGVSVQSPEEALMALDCANVQHIQMPFNVLDWRWRDAGVIEKLMSRAHLTVHVRSVYLQGVLAADDPAVWPEIAGVSPEFVVGLLREISQAHQRRNTADLCLAYARGQRWVDGVVVGMETESQLESNLRLFVCPPLADAQCREIEKQIPRLPESLLDPAKWPRR